MWDKTNNKEKQKRTKTEYSCQDVLSFCFYSAHAFLDVKENTCQLVCYSFILIVHQNSINNAYKMYKI